VVRGKRVIRFHELGSRIRKILVEAAHENSLSMVGNPSGAFCRSAFGYVLDLWCPLLEVGGLFIVAAVCFQLVRITFCTTAFVSFWISHDYVFGVADLGY
jgi:hypothetical protein